MNNTDKNTNTCCGLTLEVVGEIPECSTKIKNFPVKEIYADVNGNVFNEYGQFQGKLKKDKHGEFVFNWGGEILPEHEKEFNEAVKSFLETKKQREEKI